MKINQLKAGATLSYITMGIGYLITIVYTPIMLRLLGQSEYGLYNLVSSVVSYLGLLNFGFSSSYVRYYSRYNVKNDKQSIAKLNGMFLIIFSLISIIAIIAGTILVLNTNLIFGKELTQTELTKAKILMSIMVINMALSFPASVFNSYVTANEEYVFQKLLQMLKIVLNPFIILAVLLMGYKSIGMAVSTTILSVVVEFSNMLYCIKKLDMRFRFRDFDFSLMKKMIVFSSYIFINIIVDQINWNVDKFILGRFRGTVAVAIYGLAAQLNTYYISLSTSISSVFIPRINKMVASGKSDDELTHLFTRVGRIQFIILALIGSGLIFFGKPFVRMWGGVNYIEAYPIALLLIIPVTIPLIQNLGIEIQRAKNIHKFRSVIYLFIAIGNVVLSIPLTKTFGGIGAAVGTAISLIVGNVFIMNWYYHTRVGINIKYFWTQIFRFIPALVLPTITGIVIYIYVDLNNIINFLIFGTFYVFVYCASMWLCGMN